MSDEKVVYKELSFEVVGVMFDVHNELGAGHKEQVYQKAIAKGLKAKNIKFQEQVYFPLEYKGEKVGAYYLDFLIENKLVLEIKRNNRFSKQEFEQVQKYLETTNRKLAILASFTQDGVKFYRVLNQQPKKSFK